MENVTELSKYINEMQFIHHVEHEQYLITYLDNIRTYVNNKFVIIV